MRRLAVLAAMIVTVTLPAPSAGAGQAGHAPMVGPGAPPAASRADLGIGDAGLRVAQIQQRLASFGYSVEVDGQFGPQTARALRHFQRANGLTADAIAGPATMTALLGTATATTPAVRVTPPAAPAAFGGVEQIIRDVFPDNQEDHAIAIAYRESRFVPTARNSCCYGIFQIHFRANAPTLATLGITSPEQLLDARTNIEAAYVIYQRSGWAPWRLP